MKMKRRIIAAACMLGLASGQLAHAVSYSDQLRWDSGELELNANGVWANANTFLNYSVTKAANGWWAYSYTFNIGSQQGGLSHLIIETSPGALSSEFQKWSPFAGIFGSYSETSQGNSNPGLPVTLTGIKFNTATSPMSFTVSFESTHAPMWGDFYAKDGNAGGQPNWVYNVGIDAAMGAVYLGPDFDGSGGSPSPYPTKILVPDTITSVPDGGTTATLLGLGMLGLGYFARRRV